MGQPIYFFIMSLNVENLVRTGAIVLVGLPITLSVALSGLRETTSSAERAVADSKAKLTPACLNYAVSRKDSKLERNAKDEIDQILGADGTNYKSLCDYVLR